MHLYIRVLFVVLSLQIVMGNNSSVGTKLYRNLLLNYEKNVRPGIDYDYPTTVNCEFKFIELNRFQEIEGKLSVMGVFIIRWFDDRLIWNPYSYDGIVSTLIPEELLWKPDIAVTNAYSGVRFLTESGVSIRAVQDGTLMWVTGDTYDVQCDADVTYYPIDSQTCTINMVTWNSFSSEVTFNKVRVDTLDNYTGSNPSWDVSEITMYTQNSPDIPSDMLIIKFKLERLPEYIVINMILPVCFLCVINIFVFVLPAESGERIGFSITLLLSVAVFMTILSDSLPQSSRPQIAVLCYFLFSQLMVSILMMVFTIYGLRFYWMAPEKPIPAYLKIFSEIMDRVCMGCQCCKKRKQLAVVGPALGHVPNSGKPESNIQPVPGLDQIDPELDEYITWNKIANHFDNFCIVFFILLIVLTNVIFCGRLSSKPQL